MDHSLLVSVFERIHDLVDDRRGLIDGDRALRNHLGERGPFDQLHDESAVFHAVDGGDIRVIQRGQHVRFACEAVQPVGILSKG